LAVIVDTRREPPTPTLPTRGRGKEAAVAAEIRAHGVGKVVLFLKKRTKRLLFL
jgi:hypothetical protein